MPGGINIFSIACSYTANSYRSLDIVIERSSKRSFMTSLDHVWKISFDGIGLNDRVQHYNNNNKMQEILKDVEKLL